MKNIYIYIFKRFNPIKYARSIGVTVGKNCRLLNCVFSTEAYLVTMGDHVSASSVHFETHDGGVWVFRDEHPNIDAVKPITIGNNVYIGYGSIILPGVNIGNNVVIGAHSVVTRDIESGFVAAGIPARVIKPIGDYKEKVLLSGDMTKQMNVEQKKIFYLNKYKN